MSPRRSYDNEFQKGVTRFIVIPALALLGIFLAGVFMETLFGVPEAGKKLFWAIGGIAFFAWYFREVFRKYIKRM